MLFQNFSTNRQSDDGRNKTRVLHQVLLLKTLFYIKIPKRIMNETKSIICFLPRSSNSSGQTSCNTLASSSLTTFGGPSYAMLKSVCPGTHLLQVPYQMHWPSSILFWCATLDDQTLCKALSLNGSFLVVREK